MLRPHHGRLASGINHRSYTVPIACVHLCAREPIVFADSILPSDVASQGSHVDLRIGLTYACFQTSRHLNPASTAARQIPSTLVDAESCYRVRRVCRRTLQVTAFVRHD